jgi:hypothetical protein
MSLTSIALRTVASLAATFALLALPIVVVSSLSRGDLIGLPAGILVFASSILGPPRGGGGRNSSQVLRAP